MFIVIIRLYFDVFLLESKEKSIKLYKRNFHVTVKSHMSIRNYYYLLYNSVSVYIIPKKMQWNVS